MQEDACASSAAPFKFESLLEYPPLLSNLEQQRQILNAGQRYKTHLASIRTSLPRTRRPPQRRRRLTTGVVASHLGTRSWRGTNLCSGQFQLSLHLVQETGHGSGRVCICQLRTTSRKEWEFMSKIENPVTRSNLSSMPRRKSQVEVFLKGAVTS
jgi:hypothetical protein